MLATNSFTERNPGRTRTPFASFLASSEVRNWGLPIGLLFLGIILILLIVIPSAGKIQALRGQISTEEDRTKALEEKSRKLLNLADQSAEIEKQFKLFDQAIASEDKIPELLSEIQEISGSCGVKVTTLQFSGGLQKPEGKIQEVRIQYGSESQIDQLSCLVSTLEDASRLIDIELLRYELTINQTTGAKLVIAQATLLSYSTPVPQLSPENPITFSLSGSEFLRNIELLKGFKVY